MELRRWGLLSRKGLALIVLLLRTIAVVSMNRDKLPANRVADQAALDAQRVALESADKTNEKLEKDVHNMGKSLETTEKAVHAALKELDTREAELQSFVQELEEAQDSRSKLENILMVLERDLNEASTRMDEVRGAKKALSAAHESVKQRLTPAATETASCQQQASTLASTTVKLENTIAGKSREIVQLEAVNANLTSLLNETEDTLNITLNDLGDLIEKKKLADERCSSDMKSKDTRYREVQTERNECKSALKKAEDRISTLESSLVNRTRIAKEADAAAQEAVGKYDAMADEIEQQQATIEKLEAALANATAMAEAQSEAAGEHAATAKLWTEKHADLEESHLALQDLHRQLHDEVTGLNSFWKLKWKWDTEL